MPDNLDVILNFLTQYDGKGAQAAQADLEAMNKAQGGTSTPTTQISPKPIQDTTAALQGMRAQVQGVAQDTKKVVDQFKDMGDQWSKSHVESGITQEDINRVNQLAGAETERGKATKVASEQYTNSAQEIEQLTQKTLQSEKQQLQEEKQIQRDRAAALKPYNDAVSAAVTQQWEFRRLQYAGRALTEVSQTFFVPSVAVLTGAAALAATYVKNAQVATSTTVQWKQATESLNYSQSRIGATLASVELPLLQEAAKVVNGIASFVEAHPDAVKSVLGAAGLIATISGLGMLVAKGIRLYADIGYMGATNALMVAENALTVATQENTAAQLGKTAGGGVPGVGVPGGSSGGLMGTLGPILAVIGGILAGGAIYNAIKPKNAPTAEQVIPEAAAIWTDFMSKNVLSKLGPFGAGVEKAAKAVDTFALGLVGVKSPWSTSAATPSVPLQNQTGYQDLLQSYTTYRQSMSDNQKKYDAAMAANDEEANAQILQINDTFNQNRTRQERDRAVSEARTLEDFTDSQISNANKLDEQLAQEAADNNKQRLELAHNYGKEVERAEEDHQKEMRRMAEDHNDNMRDLTAKRDALGMIREIRTYEKNRSRAEEDYTIAARRRSEDYADQLAQLESNFKSQRAQKIADFEQQQADAKANFDKMKKRRDEDFKQQQADADADRIAQINQVITAHNQKMDTLAQNLADENALTEKAFGDKLAAMNLLITQSAVMIAAQMQSWQAQMAAFLAANGVTDINTPTGPGATTPPTRRDSGGYMYSGQRVMNTSGQNEWVLGPYATRLAEQAIGGQLNQQNAMALMMGGGRGYTDKRVQHFSNMTANDIAAFEASSRRIAREEMRRELKP